MSTVPRASPTPLTQPPHGHGVGAVGGGQPPPMPPTSTNYSNSIAQSMTIDEMRELHRQALSEAEKKRTELRLVLASRYRELVGSSDEVLHMQARAKELDELVNALPGLMEKLVRCAEGKAGTVAASTTGEEGKGEEEGKSDSQPRAERIVLLRRQLSLLPRSVHRCLDKSNVHGAATGLVDLFRLIVGQTDTYPLANVLASGCDSIAAPSKKEESLVSDPLLFAQMKMVYLHVQTLPSRTVKISRRLLLRGAGSVGWKGAQMSACAVSALDLLDVTRAKSDESQRSVKLIDLYYDSKAKLIQTLLGRLATSPTGTKEMEFGVASDMVTKTTTVATTAEEILSKIVLILQHDVILHPYQIFVLRQFPSSDSSSSVESVMSTLPTFDADLLKSKASHFLAAHLPLIRTKVKTVLMSIAGTTASALGQIRQSLYDKTDGVECMDKLDSNGICTWDDAVNGMVDVRIVSHGTTFASAGTGTAERSSSEPQQAQYSQRKFSLWSALFSNTFSSLVHSLLTTAFHSVHARVVSTLRTSLSNAPPLQSILPHEAYRNTLHITTDLDESLKTVSDDAHELLVHAEEREESERRLRQSLYVQTCEIMGRLLCELRRMLLPSSTDGEEEEATRELIVGRLCHLLKFRLTSLPTLLDPSSSPAVLSTSGGSSTSGGGGGAGKSGMITLWELRSAFDLADDDDDGLISFDEAMDAMETAFSGTPFHGAEMVRDTLLLTSSKSDGSDPTLSASAAAAPGTAEVGGVSKGTPRNVTLSELALLSARGLRHDATGSESALGTIQRSLDDIVGTCFAKWARVALLPYSAAFREKMMEFVNTARSVSDVEWRRRQHLLPGNEEEKDEVLMEISEAIHDGAKADKPNAAMPMEVVVGNVSSHVIGYLLSISSVLSRSVCPSDSLTPVPSTEYAVALGIPCGGSADAGGYESIPNMMHTIRWALLDEAVRSVAKSSWDAALGRLAERGDEEEVERGTVSPNWSRCSPSALIQIQLDVSFLQRCFFERNLHGFGPPRGKTESHEGEKDEEEERKADTDSVESSRLILDNLINSLVPKLETEMVESDVASTSLLDTITDRQRQVLAVCDLFLSSLFGEDATGATIAPTSSSLYGGTGLGGTFDGIPSASTTASAPTSLLLHPLPSSRRFVLLPIQSERSLNEVQLRGKYGKEKDGKVSAGDGVSREESGGSAVSSAVSGFFSNMLKKK